ncbi:MAG TPA: histidine phosphatase family protein [Gammaproteobacteria bacterium]|nr:histidine phosphatase family protein [Gammaproteobacteria bacterium]
MKRLLLLRHAKAVPAEEPLADIARPLADRGERDARRVGERLRQHQEPPGRILTSPAARTLQTAQIVAAAFAERADALVIERRLYLAEPAALLDVIANQEPHLDSLLVVGHNPGLSELVHDLLPQFEVDDLPTCAIVALDYPAGAEWLRIETAAPRLAYYDFPKNSREPVTAR